MPTFEITGRVVDPGGAPPSGTRIELLPGWSEYYRGLVDLGLLDPPEPVQAVAPDRTGAFSLTAPAPGVWTVRVTAPGFVAMERALRPIIHPLELDPVPLLPDEGVEAQVLDPEGRPLPGVWVGVLPTESGRAVWTTAREGRWTPARRMLATGEDGRVRIPRAPGEEVALQAFRHGGAFSVEVPTVGGVVVLRLPPGVERELRVLDALGRPAPEIGVRMGEWRWSAAFTDEHGRARVALATDAATSLWLGISEGWKIRVPVEPPGAIREKGPAEVPEPLVIRLPEPLEVQGQVTDRETGEPLADALVWAGPDARELVFTDARGRFRLETGPAERIEVSAAHPGYRGYRAPFSGAEGVVRGVTLPLRPERTVRGVVVDPSGVPVPGARVRVRSPRPGDPSWDERLEGDTATGPGGHFRFERLPLLDRLELRADADGFAPRVRTVTATEIEETEVAEGLQIVLQSAAALTGRVTDETGRPLTGARVRLFDLGDESLRHVAREHWESDFEATSGTDGDFSVTPLPASRFVVEVRHPGFATSVLRGIETRTEEAADPATEGEGGHGRVVDLGEVRLRPGAAVEGRVRTDAGEPVPGARVRTTRSQVRRLQQPGGAPPGGDPEAVSGEDGEFRLEDLTPGEEVTLVVEAKGHLEAKVPGVTAPTERPLEVILEHGTRVFGTVRDPRGRAVEGARVTARVSKVLPHGLDVDREVATTAEDGSFVIDALEPGPLALEVRATGFAPWRRTDLSTAVEGLGRGGTGAPPEVGPVEVELDRGLVLEGRVRDPRGAPADGARVAVQMDRPEHGLRYLGAERRVTRTDADGWYRLEGLAPGIGRLSAKKGSDRVEQPVEISDRSRRFDLVLESVPGVAGRVVDDAGRPVSGARVSARPLDFRTSWKSVVSGGDGGFHLPLEPGDYQLGAAKDGWVEARWEQPLRIDRETVEGVELRLRQGARITGRLSGLGPEELARVEVQAFSLDHQVARGEVTFPSGYRVEGVETGRWEVVARLDGGDRTARGRVEVAVAGEEVTLDLEFRSGVSLTGQVRLNGEPRPGLRVWLDRMDDSFHRVSLQRTTDPTGRFRFADLDPGPYRVRVEHRPGWHQSREVELTGDTELLVEGSAARVRGRLVDDSGAPVAAGRITLSSPGTAGGGNVVVGGGSGPDGGFEIDAVPEGPYRVEVRAEGHSPRAFQVEVSGPETDLGDVRLPAAAGLWLAPRLTGGGVPSEIYVSLFPEGAAGPGARRPVVSRQVPVEDGLARLAEAPAGSWRLTAAATRTLPFTVPLHIPEGGLPEPVPVELEPASELRLRVAELQRFGGEARAVVRDLDGRPYRGPAVPGQQTAGLWPLHRGTLLLSPLPAGVWNVEVTAEDGRVWTGGVETRAGQPAELVLE